MTAEAAISHRVGLGRVLRQEWLLAISIGTSVAFLLFGDALFALLANPVWLTIIFLWLFSVVLGSALSVVRHADHLAERLGEPYGTLVLTLAITAIEVTAISAVMFHGENNPTLVRDTLFAVVMIILNGMVGLSLLVGGWRRHEQHHNLQGANAYLGVIVPLATLSMIMPNFTHSPTGPAYSTVQQTVLAFISVGLYSVFLALQTGRHRGFFIEDNGDTVEHTRKEPREGPLWLPVVLLFVHMGVVVFLVEQLAPPIDYFIETLRAPAALGGVVMAVLVATPEAISAVRSSVANHLQRSVNIFLGSVLSTIGLTVPAMLLISHLSGHPVVLGLEHTDTVMLVLTLAVSMVTFASGRTHLMQGAVHLVLFIAYFLLIFEP